MDIATLRRRCLYRKVRPRQTGEPIPYYLTPKQDDFNQIPELQVCIAEALYDAEAVLSNPSAFKAEEIRALRDQIVSNLERAWEITGRSEDQLSGVMVQISQVVATQFKAEK
jgi:hypothetical protein